MSITYRNESGVSKELYAIKLEDDIYRLCVIKGTGGKVYQPGTRGRVCFDKAKTLSFKYGTSTTQPELITSYPDTSGYMACQKGGGIVFKQSTGMDLLGLGMDDDYSIYAVPCPCDSWSVDTGVKGDKPISVDVVNDSVLNFRGFENLSVSYKTEFYVCVNTWWFYPWFSSHDVPTVDYVWVSINNVLQRLSMVRNFTYSHYACRIFKGERTSNLSAHMPVSPPILKFGTLDVIDPSDRPYFRCSVQTMYTFKDD